jgi:uncharacterized protein (DUF433 family)
MHRQSQRFASLPSAWYWLPMAHDRIRRDPNVMMGKPCIAGTRITVDVILDDLADGMTVAQLLEAYEDLTEADVRAALEYAADYIREEGMIAAE